MIFQGNLAVFLLQKLGIKKEQKIAEANGILLYEFRKPTDKDWKGKIRDIFIDLHFSIPHFSSYSTIVDTHWFINKCKELSITPPQKLPTEGGLSTEIFLYDENEKKLPRYIIYKINVIAIIKLPKKL